MSWIELLRRYRKQFASHQPLIEVLIYKQNLLHNLKQYQKSYPEQQFAPVLKANAYGHGLEPVAEILKAELLPFVCVDSHFELRRVGKLAPKLSVLVIGFTRLESILKSHSEKFSFTIISLDQLVELSKKLSQPRKFHLKLDTGMHRQGLLPSEFQQADKLIRSNPHLILEGLCSHLADPDNEAESAKQIKVWNSAVAYFKQAFPQIKFFHLSATGGLKYSKQIDANLVRLGIGFYGIDNYQQVALNLKPALEMWTMISGIKTLSSGEKIGYGLTYTTTHPTQIATVPVGYFEGVDRRLSNQSGFVIRDTFCPIVGRISMDIITVDVSANKNIAFGDRVQVLSANFHARNSLSAWAEICQTIPYELLVKLPAHLSRIIVEK